MASLVTTSAPKRRKNASKKSKKSWRKNTDLDDVEEFLDDVRLEERLGGVFSQRKDEELFVIDSTNAEGVDEKKSLPDRLARRKRLAEKKLKCFQYLEVTGGVPDPKKGRNRRKLPEERKNPIVKKLEAKLEAKGFVKAKKKEATKHRAAASVAKKAAQEEAKKSHHRTEFDFDLWSQGPSADQDAANFSSCQWIPSAVSQHNLSQVGKRRRRLPRGLLKKTSALSAVEVPAAGASYNPSYQDHQELLYRAWQAEVNKDRRQHKLDYHTTRMFVKAKKGAIEATWMKEMSEGLRGALDETEEQEAESDEEAEVEDEEEEKAETVEKKSTSKLKTRKQRRKAIQLKVEERKRQISKKAKEQSQDLLRLRTIKKELVTQEKLFAQKRTKRQLQLEKKRLMEPVRLSQVTYEAPDVDVKLSEELTGDLRTMRPEGDLLEDRFKSLQKRNVIAPSMKRKATKASKRKIKRLEKRSYKMPFDKK